MRFVHEEILIDRVPPQWSGDVVTALADIRKAIQNVVWPPGSTTFTIHAQSGKKSGEGNGVKPIRSAFAANLIHETDWKAEVAVDFDASATRPGNIDVVLRSPAGLFCVEWETGNISSCHRSLNKLCLGLLKGRILFGTVIVPSRKMYPFLTDRIANYDELVPYFSFWKAFPVEAGYLSVIVVEHDAASISVPRIPKGRDGNSKA